MTTREQPDIHIRTILRHLNELEELIADEFVSESLELDDDYNTTQAYNNLQRIKRSLTQYAERKGELFYVGFLGHFSSGKSSTINSLLDLWGSNQVRDTSQNPTDQMLTKVLHLRCAQCIFLLSAIP